MTLRSFSETHQAGWKCLLRQWMLWMRRLPRIRIRSGIHRHNWGQRPQPLPQSAETTSSGFQRTKERQRNIFNSAITKQSHYENIFTTFQSFWRNLKSFNPVSNMFHFALIHQAKTNQRLGTKIRSFFMVSSVPKIKLSWTSWPAYNVRARLHLMRNIFNPGQFLATLLAVHLTPCR